jgi:hypothetical protein
MSMSGNKTPHRRLKMVVAVVGAAVANLVAHGLEVTPPRIEAFHPPEQEDQSDAPEAITAGDILKLNTTLFRDTTIIDFEKRQISFLRIDAFSGQPVWEYHYDELEDYLNSMQNLTLGRLWHGSHAPLTAKTKKDENLPSLDFMLPVNYPAWARRVLGREPPRLSIKGYESITLSMRSFTKKIAGDYAKESQKPGLQPDFSQDNAFNIQGSIGRLINVSIKAGKGEELQNVSDQLKDFKIEYKEDSSGQLEDEVIQEVTAGFTNFEMPGAGLSGYSESAEGLFGIKVKSKLGPLMLTTIASHQKGEVQKDTIDLNMGGGGGDKSVIQERAFAQNRYFFLDDFYLRKYNGQTSDTTTVTDLRIYRCLRPSQERLDRTQTYATAFFGNSNPKDIGNFVLLKRDEQYYLDKKNGWIRFAESERIEDDDIIAIFMRTTDSLLVPNKGDTARRIIDTVFNDLWVLKDRQPKPDNPTFNLMWRNAYKINGNPPANKFNITITRKGVDPPTEKIGGKFFTEILGLTSSDGKFKQQLTAENADGINQIYDQENGYLIIRLPPEGSDTTLSNRPFANPALGNTNGLANTNPRIYTTSPNDAEWQSQMTDVFDITLIGASDRKTTFSLGFNITPETERVIMNGSTVLTRYKDYSIDYMSGSLELISAQARSANKLEVEYQREALLMFDRKAFVGLNGKIDLPNIGRDSYIASSILFQSTTAGKKMPRINQIPFNKLLLGLNTKLDFEPEWMTTLVNAIPLVKTDAASSITFDAEIAHSSMMPNSGSQASIENFESSSQIYDIGVSDDNRWFRCSPPSDLNVKTTGGLDSLLWRPPAWWWYWYNPDRGEKMLDSRILNDEFNKPHHFTKRTDIWAELKEGVDIKTTEDDVIRTLRLRCEPAPPDSQISTDNFKAPWAGIMTTIPVSLSNLKDNRYLEILLQPPVDDPGSVLYVDLGNISEDVCINGNMPNGRWDKEDPDLSFSTLRDSLDRGLDGLRDNDEQYIYPNFSSGIPHWDSLGYGRTELGRFKLDPGRDNWHGNYRYDSLMNREWVNGLESDRTKESEDINDDGFRKGEDFFRYQIDLGNVNSSRFLDRSVKLKNRWCLFRIPINDSTFVNKIVGKPRWDQILFVRMWWSDFENKTGERSLEFAQIQFVGNQWRSHATGDSIKIEATEISNKDNGGYYIPPVPVKHQLDYEQNETEVEPEEHALRLNYNNLKPGEAAYVERFFTNYQEIDLSPYNQIGLYVKDRMRADPATWFILRFGLNDSTYYEYRTRNLTAAWDGGIAIDLRRFSTLKLDYLSNSPNERATYDTAMYLEGGSVYRIYSPTKTAPTFSKVQWMALGVSRDNNAFGVDTGEIWIDDIHIRGLKSLTGLAFRSNLSTRWSDFMDLSADVRYDDADFRQMADNSLTPRESKFSTALNAQVSINKFLPQELGISIPLGASITSTLARPKVRPESDIYLVDKDNKADNLTDMAADFADQVLGTQLSGERTEAENYEKENVSRAWFTGYSKNSVSDNPLVNLTADRITIDARVTRDGAVTGRGRHLNPDSVMYRDVDNRSTYSGTLNYNLSPKKPAEWTRWRPFEKMKDSKLFPRLRDYELTFLPKTLNFKLANVSYQNSQHMETKRPENDLTRRQLDLTHGLQFSFEPIRPLVEMTYDIDISRDLDNDIDRWSDDLTSFARDRILTLDPVWKDYLVTYGEQSRTQKASLNLNPELVDWLSNTASYTVNYSQNPQEVRSVDTRFIKGNVGTQTTLRSSFRINTLITSLMDAAEKNKILKGVFETMDKGLTKISLRELTFTYDASTTLLNDYLSTSLLSSKGITRRKFMQYQLGLRKGMFTRDMDDSEFGGMRSRYHTGFAFDDSLELWENDRREANRKFSLKTDLRLPDPLDLSITPVSFGWGKTYSIKPQFQAYIDTIITFPDLEVGLSSGVLQKMPFIKTAMNSLRANSSFQYVSICKIGTPQNNDLQANIDMKNEFSMNPLIGLNGTVSKWPIDISYNHTFKKAISKNYTRPDRADYAKTGVARSHANAWTVAYKTHASKLTEIKILRWKIPIKGELNMGLEANQSHEVSTLKVGTPGAEEQSVTDLTSIDVKPHVSYYFTNNIQGTVEYLGRQTKDKKKSDETETEHAFSLTVRIDF